MLQTTQYLTTLYIIDCLKENAKTPCVVIASSNRNMFGKYEIIFGNIDDINRNIVDRIFQHNSIHGYLFINRTALTYASSFIFDIYTKPGKKLPTIFDNLDIFTLCTEDVYLSKQPLTHDITCVLQKNRYGSRTIDDKSNKYYIADSCLYAKNTDFVLDLTKFVEVL